MTADDDPKGASGSGGGPASGAPELDPLGSRLQDALGAEYAVEGKLGAGGFAVVYLVRDVHLKRKLAVKVLSPDVIASKTALERFRREAETIAQLSHPHIVPLHFIGHKDDLVYLVMQAVEGGSLFERIEKQRQLPIADAARIFAEVASALAHAHKRGVVHRDIKPQNVLLDAESGRALVTDFGIARTAEGASLTATGMVVGTPAYLSPEQVTGEPSDHRADIYALGVMAYEMLAGRAPFTGATPTAVLMKRLAGPPEPLRSIRPDIPTALVELVDACLAANPNDRIGNAADITRALTGASPVSGGHTTTTGIRVVAGRKRWAVPALAGGALVLAVAAYLLVPRAGVNDRQGLASVDSGMVLIPGGEYFIGTNYTTARADMRPAHKVRIEAFGLDRHEVTIGEYQEFVKAGRAPATWVPGAALDLPVTGVLYGEAAGYCAWKHRDGGRLPTEEEWEAAARGEPGWNWNYPWGADWVAGAANTASQLRGGPAPVGSYPLGRSPGGVDDLIGNVWEWTSSPYRPYVDTSAAPTTGEYVIRGGAYNSIQAVATSWFRAPARSAAARGDLAATGFRCAMTPRLPLR